VSILSTHHAPPPLCCFRPYGAWLFLCHGHLQSRFDAFTLLWSPDLLVEVQLGHKCKLRSRILPSFTDLFMMLAPEYTSSRNCTRHFSLFHHIGMTLIGVTCERIPKFSAIAAMCSNGTASVLSAPQVMSQNKIH